MQLTEEFLTKLEFKLIGSEKRFREEVSDQEDIINQTEMNAE